MKWHIMMQNTQMCCPDHVNISRHSNSYLLTWVTTSCCSKTAAKQYAPYSEAFFSCTGGLFVTVGRLSQQGRVLQQPSYSWEIWTKPLCSVTVYKATKFIFLFRKNAAMYVQNTDFELIWIFFIGMNASVLYSILSCLTCSSYKKQRPFRADWLRKYIVTVRYCIAVSIHVKRIPWIPGILNICKDVFLN